MIEALLGALTGSIAGIIPGLHANVIAAFTLTLTNKPDTIIPFLTATAISHSITDAIPSTFLGAPSSETALSVLPAHKMLLEGKGYEAVMIATKASITTMIIITILTPALLIIMPAIYNITKNNLFYILTATTAFWLANYKIKTTIIFFISGLLGMLTLESTKNPLFPLLSGLFGISTLMFTANTEIPKPIKSQQTKTQPTAIILGIIGAIIINILPATSTSFAAALLANSQPQSYIALVSSINAADQALTGTVLASMQKARSGVAEAINHASKISNSDMLYLSGIMLMSAGIATIITIIAAKKANKLIQKIPYQKTSIATILLIIIATIIFSNWRGLIVLITATAIGTLAKTLNCPQTSTIGCLILPTIIQLAPK